MPLDRPMELYSASLCVSSRKLFVREPSMIERTSGVDDSANAGMLGQLIRCSTSSILEQWLRGHTQSYEID